MTPNKFHDDLLIKQGQQDAWNLVKKIVNPVSDGGYSQDELFDIFGRRLPISVLQDYTYDSATERIRIYEAEHIEIGDEVKINGFPDCGPEARFVVMWVSETDSRICGISSNGKYYSTTFNCVTKTGRHFNEIAKLFEAMKKEG